MQAVNLLDPGVGALGQDLRSDIAQTISHVECFGAVADAQALAAALTDAAAITRGVGTFVVTRGAATRTYTVALVSGVPMITAVA